MNAHQALDTIVRQAALGELVFPTHMSASLRLQRTLAEPDCHLENAAALVVAEPLIAARLVAIANSVAYTRFGGHVSNVRTALTLLGLNPLKSLVAVIVVRQLASEISDPKLRQQAELLWRHCAEVAALAKILAREFTTVPPETALFAGVVHEIDGFYLLSRADEFPALLEMDGDATPDRARAAPDQARAALAGCIFIALKIPRLVAAAMASLYDEVPPTVPVTLGDVLALANHLASQPSPLSARARLAPPDTFDFAVGDKTLRGVLKSSTDEIKALTDALLL